MTAIPCNEIIYLMDSRNCDVYGVLRSLLRYNLIGDNLLCKIGYFIVELQ